MATFQDSRLVMDDLLAAIGSCSYKVALVGSTKWGPITGSVFIIKKIGVYLRDTYDFNGVDEILGFWDKNKYYSFLEKLKEGGNLVKNGEFRLWQNMKHQGGDFIVYSNDVLWYEPEKNRETIYLDLVK